MCLYGRFLISLDVDTIPLKNASVSDSAIGQHLSDNKICAQMVGAFMQPGP